MDKSNCNVKFLWENVAYLYETSRSACAERRIEERGKGTLTLTVFTLQQQLHIPDEIVHIFGENHLLYVLFLLY